MKIERKRNFAIARIPNMEGRGLFMQMPGLKTPTWMLIEAYPTWKRAEAALLRREPLAVRCTKLRILYKDRHEAWGDQVLFYRTYAGNPILDGRELACAYRLVMMGDDLTMGQFNGRT